MKRKNGFTLIELPFDKLRVVRKRKSAAFTLIELLVVIAILALLISILVPSLQRAKEAARRVACQSNVRSLALGFLMYGEEWNGYWPAGWNLGSDTWWFVVMNEYTGGQEDAFVCPSDENGSFGRYFISYGYNTCLNRYGGDFHYPKIAEIRNPYQKILMGETYDPFDGSPFYPTPQGRCLMYGSYSAYYGLHGRHDSSCSISWADGHVSFENPDEFNYDRKYWWWNVE